MAEPIRRRSLLSLCFTATRGVEREFRFLWNFKGRELEEGVLPISPLHNE